MDQTFYEERREQSIIKSRIISKYFSVWAKVILSSQKRFPQDDNRMAYIDLFAGPGQYKDHSESTPLSVLKIILADAELTERMVTIFNDIDKDSIEKLREAISQLEGVERLKYAPEFFTDEVGEDIVKMFNEIAVVPAFFFIDPWGYKGLSLSLISSILKDWGCDCVFFFNYNRIRPGVNNEKVQKHMVSLFGREQLALIQQECAGKSPEESETIIIDKLCGALKDDGKRFVLPFRFKNDKGTRTSHHLIFISKSFRGYDIMKSIMVKESTDNAAGVASFEFNPSDRRYERGSLLDMLSRPLDDLRGMLLQQYAGRTIDFSKLYEEHSVDKPFVWENYQDVFKTMLAEGAITAVSRKTGKPPKRGTFSKEMQITFGEVL